MIGVLLFALAAFVLAYAIPGVLGFVLALGLPALVAIMTALTQGADDLAWGTLVLTLVLCLVAAIIGRVLAERQGVSGGRTTAA